MADCQSAIIELLTGDPELTGSQPTGLGFTVVNRFPVKPGVPGATPEAFDANQGNRMKRLLVVLEGGESPHPSPRPGFGRSRNISQPQIQIIAEAHQSGKDAAMDADKRIISILTYTEVVQGTGNERERISFDKGSRLPRQDFDGFPGNVRTIRNVLATWTSQA